MTYRPPFIDEFTCWTSLYTCRSNHQLNNEIDISPTKHDAPEVWNGMC